MHLLFAVQLGHMVVQGGLLVVQARQKRCFTLGLLVVQGGLLVVQAGHTGVQGGLLVVQANLSSTVALDIIL